MRVKVISGAHVGEEGDVRGSTADGQFLRVLLGATFHWIANSDCEEFNEEVREGDSESA